MQEPQPLPVEGQQASPDYQLLLTRLEQQTYGGEGGLDPAVALASEALWQGLTPAGLLRASLIAQAAGAAELGLRILRWTNSAHPDFAPAWQEALELLALLGREQELIAVRAAAMGRFGRESAAGWLKEAISVVGLEPGSAKEDTDASQAGEQVPRLADGLAGVCGPFVDLAREERRLNDYMRIFQGREEVFARQWYDAERKESGYSPVHRPLSPADLREHLNGRRTLGIYLLRADSLARVGVIDIDLVRGLRDRRVTAKEQEQVRREATYLLTRLSELAHRAGITTIAEFSGGKGYHLWFPAAEPMAAATLRRALLALAGKVKADVSCFELEVFPKQDKLSGKGLGNLVKLPLGIHRQTGKPSYFLNVRDRGIETQLDHLVTIKPTPPAALERAAGLHAAAEVVVHPRHAAWAQEFPELATLEGRCAMLAQIFAGLRAGRGLDLKAEKILLAVIGHLPRGKILLHHLCAALPDYNRHLLDFRISRLRGTPLGCRRIHSLLGAGEADLPCRFAGNPRYLHPLLHLPDYDAKTPQPVAERVENLRDALDHLCQAIRVVERFMPREG